MNKTEIVKIIDNEKLVFVTRLKTHKQIPRVIESLSNAGVKVLEITSNTPNYANEIKKARALYPNILIGAGTVINEKIALEAINKGAQFLVTPNTNPALISIAHQNNIPILMGALTPTEVCIAAEAGADFVKLFPADIMGIPYFKSIKAPLDKIKLLAVGGIELNTVKKWFESGAYGIGIASVIKDDLKTDEDFLEIENNARNFINEIKNL
ncbi:bifunctional 4-hydroxy-2-oxoglutarate aldolase/2-dehydro-3-deoxy-phosphogluconate aldolase [Postechiella marina]|uniref:Bifunctional 4-hydroxy-2-oxoglutarate aldolase/2-dehydro-3-deoxy-phosphogluconate aldolase n=1 Tax=Postechiella marina TaxID=943941 RepID=A0ABP8CB25_9FLAO